MMAEKVGRPDRDRYFMGIAIAVRERADCKGQKVGAVIVQEDRIISSGYNGTPENFLNCSDGGCLRCENRGKVYASGTAYDLCICVHAEQNALLAAARFGISVQGATIYSTTQPCFGCLKELLQSKIHKIYYLHFWTSARSPEQDRQYKPLIAGFPEGVVHLDMEDERKDWALATGKAAAKVTDEHGVESE